MHCSALHPQAGRDTEAVPGLTQWLDSLKLQHCNAVAEEWCQRQSSQSVIDALDGGSRLFVGIYMKRFALDLLGVMFSGVVQDFQQAGPKPE